MVFFFGLLLFISSVHYVLDVKFLEFMIKLLVLLSVWFSSHNEYWDSNIDDLLTCHWPINVVLHLQHGMVGTVAPIIGINIINIAQMTIFQPKAFMIEKGKKKKKSIHRMKFHSIHRNLYRKYKSPQRWMENSIHQINWYKSI